MRRCSSLSALLPPQHHLLSPLGIHQSSLSTLLMIKTKPHAFCSRIQLHLFWLHGTASPLPLLLLKVKGHLNDAQAARSFISVKGCLLYADAGMMHGPAGSILYQSLTLTSLKRSL